ncbi:MFS transporter [Saccharothrix yanglingensis]|uniref:MFS transporter n=1 Tax=Saccharothrix yanglingensis TaxID=659496 RepID=A0ABU0WV61_9PSEU|nr:MFS transporter [Saccharothrix yanglingensis]MDQ2583735.1 MFS transporter [Saccharothrix yanglingensis]
MRRLPTVALFGHAVLTQVVTFVLRPTASYRALELDVPASWLGALSACFALVPLVLALPAGHVVDRVGERRVLVAGSVLMAGAAAVFAFLDGGLPGLLAGSVLLGTAHLCCVVGQQALVANAASGRGLDSAFGYYTFAASLGQLLGPLLIPVFGGGGSIPDTGPIFLGTFLVGTLLVVFAAPLPSSRTGRERAAGGSVGLGPLLRLPGLARALTTSCVVIAAVDISLVYLPALGAERDLSAGLVSALLALRAAASMVSRVLLGKLSAALGRTRLLVGSVAMAAVGLACCALPVPVWALVAAVVVAGLGLGVGQPLTMSWLAESAPPGARGRAMSLRLTGNRAGQVVVPAAVGAVAAGLGAAGVLGLTAVTLAWTGYLARRLSVD